MPLTYDDAVTMFWFGVAFLNLSLLRRSCSLISLLIVWFAIFPVFESAVRAAMSHYFLLHPQSLWELSVVATLPYMLAVMVLAVRWRRRFRPSPGA